MGPRAGLSSVLVAGALVLLAAIAIGNNMGNRVLGQIVRRVPTLATTALPTATPAPIGNPASQALWKRRQVLSVATDPAFPDPRITPEPEPVQTYRPQQSRRPKATPLPTPPPTEAPHPVRGSGNYTSPPMPIPLITHAAGETTSPDDAPPSAPVPRPSGGSPTASLTPNP